MADEYHETIIPAAPMIESQRNRRGQEREVKENKRRRREARTNTDINP